MRSLNFNWPPGFPLRPFYFAEGSAMRKSSMHLDDLAREAAAIAASSKATVVASGVGLAAWVASVNWLGWIAAIVGLLTYGTNVFFQWRRDERERHEARQRDRESAERLEMDKRESAARIEYMKRGQQ
jgi:hypothetical protein